MFHFDLSRLGAGMLAASPVLLNVIDAKLAWWCGVAFAVVAPYLMAIRTKGGEQNHTP